MARVFEAITEELSSFINDQKMFFVATAPLSSTGHVNVSPKGMDSFRVLSENSVAYLDLTGSGNETAAHVTENGRITFMFCAFDHPPRILRLYGTGRIILPDSPMWTELSTLFPPYAGARQIILAEISRVQTSCGYAVPLLEFMGERDTLVRWAEHKGEEGLSTYRSEKNARSIDGLPAPVCDMNSEVRRTAG